MEEYNGILKRFISTVDIPYEEDKTGNYSFTINNLHSKHNSSWFSLYFSGNNTKYCNDYGFILEGRHLSSRGFVYKKRVFLKKLNRNVCGFEFKVRLVSTPLN